MTDFNDIKRRLRLLSEKRNFFFKNTTKADAEKYLQAKTAFAGLNDDEIDTLELTLAKKFPLVFRQYLLEFGKNCGDLFCEGQDLVPEEIVNYQTWAKEIVEDAALKSSLNDHSIVFSFHQGYSFYYFNTAEDYAVYLYVDGDDEAGKWPQRMFDNFFAYLENQVRIMEEINLKWQSSNGHFLTIRNGFHVSEYPAKNEGIKPREIGDRFI